MKKNQMEVMRTARNNALQRGVTFHTMNLAHPSGKKKGGNIIAAVEKLDSKSFNIGEYGDLLIKLSGINLYRVQFSFCSPHEKNPSRTFGEGQAALRFFNDKSAMVMQVGRNDKLSHNLRIAALMYANQRRVPWLKDATVKDLV